MSNIPWHSLSVEETLRRLGAAQIGLAESEVSERLARFGPNLLPQPKPVSPLEVFVRQFVSPLMYLVLAALGFSVLLGNVFDSLFIVFVILINTTVGFIQEYRGERAIEKLKRLERVNTRVRRADGERLVPSELLVPGDIVLYSAGDKVSADARLLTASGLRVNEAPLSGEWLGVLKDPAKILPQSTALADRVNTVFSGTLVEEGWASAIVVETGERSELGNIAKLIGAPSEERTLLQRRLAKLARGLGAVILGFVAIVFVVGWFRAQALDQLFVALIALTVSAIPEGLLSLITVAMVVGTRRILRERALVRHLGALETLGSVTVIATDKTGTLTEGTMEVSHIFASRQELLARPPRLARPTGLMEPSSAHLEALTIASLASDAFVEHGKDELQERAFHGRPTDVAVLRAAMEAGIEREALARTLERIDFLPFDADRRLTASLYRNVSSGNISLFVFGAPDTLVERSASVRTQEGIGQPLHVQERSEILALVGELASRGLRILAVARRDFTLRPEASLSETARELVFVGLIVLRDPLRHDAKASLALTQAAGIRTLIVTGDHRRTAEAVLQELGISIEPNEVLEGADIDAMADKELRERLATAKLCARISPGGKLRVVEALHERGEVVAMIGDGVNDAPSLKVADVGVAVASGTDVAREVSDIVLLDGSFRTLVSAVEQGRVIFGNIRKLFTYLLADDFSELFLFFGAMLAGLPVPLLPAHILWINIVEDSFPGIALAFENEKRDQLRVPPRRPQEGIVHRPLKHWFAAIFFITGIAALTTFASMLALTNDLERTRTTVFALMVVDSLVFSFVLRSFRRSVFRRDIFSNRLLVAAAGIGAMLLAGAIYFPPLATVVHTVPLGLQEWLVVAGVSITELLLLEWTKKIVFAR